MAYNTREYIDEIMLRLSRYNVSFEMDESILLSILNDARQRIQLSCLYVYPERFSAIMTLDKVPGQEVGFLESDVIPCNIKDFNGNDTIIELPWFQLWLPQDFIDVFSLWVATDWGADIENWVYPEKRWYEARRVSNREIFQSTTNSVVRPQPYLPSYTIINGPHDIMTKDSFYKKYRYQLLLCLGAQDNPTPPDPANVMIYYVRMLPYLQLYNADNLPDVDYGIPFELQEFVIMQSVVMAMIRSNAYTPAAIVANELEHEMAYLEEQYNIMIDKQQLVLPSREGLYQNTYVPQRGIPQQQEQ